jgi:hypothetical protein
MPFTRESSSTDVQRTQHGVKALDGGDADPADAVEILPAGHETPNISESYFAVEEFLQGRRKKQ